MEFKRNDLINKDVISHLYSYYQTLKKGRLIIITTGTLSEEAGLLAEQHQILVWDIYTLYNLSQKEVEEIYIDSLFICKPRIHKRKTKESGFINELNSLNSGHEYWSAFQKLTSDILEHLFCPPLETPRYEHTDSDKKNRRDMIFENSCESGFWRSIRDTYRAFYIVVDAKNYSNALKKSQIIEIAHYLKPYGCGMFGIAVSRKGASSSAEHAIKEQWIGNKKMIVSLSDSDLKEMLQIKESGGNAEQLIRRKISDFRTAL